MRWLLHSPVKQFVWLSVVFGIAFVALIPPFQGPDEVTHFLRAYEVSSLQNAHRHHGGKVDLEGSYMPESIKLTYDKARLFLMPNNPDVPQAKKYFLNQTRDSLNIPLNKNRKIFYDTAASPAYVPILYVPQALMIKTFEIFNAPVIVMLYAVRLICLAIWIILGVVALRQIQSKRMRFGIAALMTLPMFVSQSIVPGTDALLTGVTLLFFISVYNLYHRRKEVTTTAYLFLSSLLFLMVAAKPVYLVFGALMLTLKYHSKKFLNWLLAVIGPAIIGALYVAWSYVTRYGSPHVYIDTVDAVHASPAAQLHFIIPNIFNFIEPLANTLFLGWGDSTLLSLVGTFGRLDTPLPLLFILIGFFLILLTVFAKEEEITDMPHRKYFLPMVLLTAALYSVGVILSMYIISTPPHAKIVTGVQGRYFLPIVLMLAVFMPKFLLVKKDTLRMIYAITPVLLLSASLLVIWLRYYLIYPR